MKSLRNTLFAYFLATLACTTIIPATTPSRIEVDSTSASVVVVEPSSSSAMDHDFGWIARGHIKALTDIGPRVPGTDNELEAGQYILETLTRLGYSPETQSFSARDEDDSEFTSMNVIAVKQGSSPKEIIVGAHYDSGDESLGADDNASGVGVLLEVAEHIADLETPYTLRFIAFGSEENDLDGSYYYTSQMNQADVDNTIAMVNLDSLAAGDITYAYSDEGEDAFLRDWVLAWAGENRIPLRTISNVDLTDDGYVADYGAFVDRGIPYLYFESTNWSLGDKDGWTQVDLQYGDEGYIWHTRYDNLEYLDATFPGRVDEHMRIFVSALFALCTEFKLP